MWAYLMGGLLVTALFVFLYKRWSDLNQLGLVAKETESKRRLEEEARLKLEAEMAAQRAEERRVEEITAGKIIREPGVADAADFLRESFGSSSKAN